MTDLLVQLQSIASARAEIPLIRFNPRPAGVIREGSASDTVLKYLRASQGFRNESQIIFATKRSHSAVSWALLYLARQGLIESAPEIHRNIRYRRYRAKSPEQSND